MPYRAINSFNVIRLKSLSTKRQICAIEYIIPPHRGIYYSIKYKHLVYSILHFANLTLINMFLVIKLRMFRALADNLNAKQCTEWIYKNIRCND